MARALWKGSISFGLVTVPIRVGLRDRGTRGELAFNLPHEIAAGTTDFQRTSTVILPPRNS